MIRRRKTIDSVDREILRLLYQGRRPMTGNQMSKRINISPPAIKPRLINLKSQGIIKPVKTSGLRSYPRTFNNKTINIKAPRSIYWDLDLMKTTRTKRKIRTIR